MSCDKAVIRKASSVFANPGPTSFIALMTWTFSANWRIMGVQPGEQILCYYPDGTIRIWADKNARDGEIAKWRYGHPFYKANQRLTATGYNMVNLGGL